MPKKSLPNSSAKRPALPPYVANQDPQFSFLMGTDFPEKHNIAWRIELAQDDPANPLIEPKYPWDAGSIASYGTVMLDPTDDLWKMWYISRHPSTRAHLAPRNRLGPYIRGVGGWGALEPPRAGHFPSRREEDKHHFRS